MQLGHKIYICKIFKYTDAGINEQGKTGEQKTNDIGGEVLSVEYSERNGHYIQTYF